MRYRHARTAAQGLAPRLTAPDKFAAIKRLDARIATTDGRELQLTRYMQPQPELLLERFRLTLPAQPPPKISAAKSVSAYLLPSTLGDSP